MTTNWSWAILAAARGPEKQDDAHTRCREAYSRHNSYSFRMEANTQSYSFSCFSTENQILKATHVDTLECRPRYQAKLLLIALAMEFHS